MNSMTLNLVNRCADFINFVLVEIQKVRLAIINVHSFFFCFFVSGGGLWKRKETQLNMRDIWKVGGDSIRIGE